MRILFSMRHSGALRNFASTLLALAARNHQVHLVFSQQDREGDSRLLWELTNGSPNITCSDLENKAPWRVWRAVSSELDCDVDVHYGKSFAGALSAKPVSAFLAEGSPITVRRGVRMSL